MDVPPPEPPKPPRICLGCGAPIIYGKNFCSSCGVIVARDELIKSAKRGRTAAQRPEAQARRTETQRLNANAQLTWEKSRQARISDEVYRREIQPRLAGVTIPTIMSALNVCASYAADIRRGRRRPHARHWQGLAQLAGVSPETLTNSFNQNLRPNPNACASPHSDLWGIQASYPPL